MRIGSRIFPYPVLNHDTIISDYNDECHFDMMVDLNDNGEIIKTRNSLILKNVHFVLDDDDLFMLYKKGLAKCYLIVESSTSIFREKYEISNEPKDILVPLGNLKNDVYISSYFCAIEDINDYKSNGFREEYKDISFNFEKYDILAVDDGFRFPIDFDNNENSGYSSIFEIIKNENAKNIMDCEMDSKKIIIYLSPKYFDIYSNLKKSAQFNNIFYSMIVIPTLTNCISVIQKNYSDVEDISDIIEDYKWVESLAYSYKKETGNQLTIDILMNNNSLVLAQIVFNYSTTLGIEDFSNIIFHDLKGSDDTDD